MCVGTYTEGPAKTTGSFTATPGIKAGLKETKIDMGRFYASKDFYDPVKDRRINYGWALTAGPTNVRCLEGYLLFRTLQERSRLFSGICGVVKTLTAIMWQPPGSKKIDQRFENWRLQRMSQIMKFMRNFFLFLSLVQVCRSEQVIAQWEDANTLVKFRCCYFPLGATLSNIMIQYFLSRPLTARSADSFYMVSLRFFCQTCSCN